MDMQSQFERHSGAPLPQTLIDKVTRKTPGMGDSTIASDSDNDSLFSFITTALDSRTQKAASAPPPSAWDKPMREVSIAPTYRLNSYTAQQPSTPPQAPPVTPSASDEETASLQSTIAQLKSDNAIYESKQTEL
jgi:hypothetical protein